MKRESIYAAALAIWWLTIAHLSAGLVSASPLLGGPSYLDLATRIGISDWRLAQTLATMLILIGSAVAAHVPLYVCVVPGTGSEGAQERVRESPR